MGFLPFATQHILVLLQRKLRLRDADCLAQGHPALKWGARIWTQWGMGWGGTASVFSFIITMLLCAAFFSPSVSLLMHSLLEALSPCWLGSEMPEAFARRVWTWWALVGSWLPSGALGPGRAKCAVFPGAWGCRGNGEGGRGKPGSWSWASRATTSLLI